MSHLTYHFFQKVRIAREEAQLTVRIHAFVGAHGFVGSPTEADAAAYVAHLEKASREWHAARASAEQAKDLASSVAAAAKAETTSPATVSYCYSVDQGENYTRCELEGRGAALVEAITSARERGFTSVHFGEVREFTHADFVGGLGESVLERLCEMACNEVGEHGDEYPDLNTSSFEERLEAFVLGELNRQAEQPRFFQAINEAQFAVDEQSTEDAP